MIKIIYKPRYHLVLRDGRELNLSESHIVQVVINTNPNNTVRWEELSLTPKELLRKQLIHTKRGNLKHRGVSNKSLVYVKNPRALDPPARKLPVDPYTLGVVLGDGRIQKPSCSVELTTHIDDLSTYQKCIPYPFGKGRFDKRHPSTWTQSIRGLGPALKALGLGVHGNNKFIPEMYFRGSIKQRLALLQGLMDTDGTISKTGRTVFSSVSPKLLAGMMRLTRSLGGIASQSKKSFSTELWLNKPMFRLPRKRQRQRFDRRADRVALVSIERMSDQPRDCNYQGKPIT